MPGLAALCREVLLFRDEPLARRSQSQRPDGSQGGNCPFFFGVDLEPLLDRLTTAPPDNRLWVPAPSNALLLVAKLAEWLRPTGRRILFWWRSDDDVSGYIAVEGYRLALCVQPGSPDALEKLERAQHVGFCDCPEDFAPAPRPQSGFLDKITLQSRHVAMMDEYLKSR